VTRNEQAEQLAFRTTVAIMFIGGALLGSALHAWGGWSLVLPCIAGMTLYTATTLVIGVAHGRRTTNEDT
jgi:1,4-dihydroxy-2-naphthoate octaprenyltransferase